MRERFKQWPLKTMLNQGWVMGAIATPVVVGMVWWLGILPARGLASDGDRRSHPDTATVALPHGDSFIRDMGPIATVIGGIFLLIKFRFAHSTVETVNLSGIDLGGVNLSGADLSGADLSGTDLSGANLSGANLSGADLSGADLSGANLSGADLSGTEFRYANLSDADLCSVNLSGANLSSAILSGADLNCAILTDANLSDANLSNALLFFINLREVLNLEPLQLEATPPPFLCNVALPDYFKQPDVNPNRSCDCMPRLLSARYDISLEEAQAIVHEARQHHWGNPKQAFHRTSKAMLMG